MLWIISIAIDVIVLLGAVVVIGFVWSDDIVHSLVYYVCGASFGGYVVFRHRQIKELLSN